jgi:hypothetical protein
MDEGMTTTAFTLDGYRIIESLQRRGTNAIVGVRYDATEIMSGVTEVLCYGTAVVVEPLDGYPEEPA